MNRKRPTRTDRSPRHHATVCRRIVGLALGALLAAAGRVEAAAPRSAEPEAPRAASPLGMKGFPPPLALPRRTVELADPNALFVRLKQGGLIDGRIELEQLRDGGTAYVKPIASATVPSPLRARLATSFRMALNQLNTRATCRDLFEQLHANGPVMLATTIYIASDGEHEVQMCDRAGGAAYTWLGQPTTYLCPSFAQLSPKDAAMSLLHEALHYAGLPERPVHRGAMSSREISALVRTRCGL
ncbi:MAG: hypothetical protein HY825_03935 [Acidobacteria bacterium]|nr:hypothetical protein [Acidobacteriota bacterium]